MRDKQWRSYLSVRQWARPDQPSPAWLPNLKFANSCPVRRPGETTPIEDRCNTLVGIGPSRGLDAQGLNSSALNDDLLRNGTSWRIARVLDELKASGAPDRRSRFP